jgi:hypothetical protein
LVRRTWNPFRFKSDLSVGKGSKGHQAGAAH